MNKKTNPFVPGNGIIPPFLPGRGEELEGFIHALKSYGIKPNQQEVQ